MSFGATENPTLVDLLSAWSWDPSMLAGVVLAASLYSRGWWRLRRRNHGGPLAWRIWCYGSGLVALALALLSPIATFDDQLFSLHMLQHMLLLIVAPVLIWLGAPLLPVLWGLPARTRRSLGRLAGPSTAVHRFGHHLTYAPVAAALYLAAIAIWHIPALYDAAQGGSLLHALEHLTFLGLGLLYWWPVIHPSGGTRRLEYSIPYLMLAGAEGGLLGGTLTIVNHPLYPIYEQATRLWGLSALDDQQLGGMIMWALGGIAYGVVSLTLVLFTTLLG
jgi:cytochrome c oxidase assembly factor CtaG